MRWCPHSLFVREAAGVPKEWGQCPVCKGHGIHPDDVAESEAWKKTEPPAGDGYQLWSTTTEGHPMSPVFKTLDELCDYAAENCSTFADFKVTAEQWKQMLGKGFVSHQAGNIVFC